MIEDDGADVSRTNERLLTTTSTSTLWTQEASRFSHLEGGSDHLDFSPVLRTCRLCPQHHFYESPMNPDSRREHPLYLARTLGRTLG